jgi:hypothetical protein
LNQKRKRKRKSSQFATKFWVRQLDDPHHTMAQQIITLGEQIVEEQGKVTW